MNNLSLTSFVKQFPSIFITGTDTEVGKTFCTSLMTKKLIQEGVDVFPFKPIAAGTEYSEDLNQEVNEDAMSLHLATNKKYPISQINPIRFAPAIAPHIAAEQDGRVLDFNSLDDALETVSELGECRLIEGAGGWLLPLNEHQLMSDWVAQHEIPVIMVVAIKLGCLNHALLTAQAIEHAGCELVGWIANFKDRHTDIDLANAAFIKQKLKAPLLFSVKKGQDSL
ncbi:MAG: dethiobiotin synthase [Gammaproteobacteria bacterium]|nr:dethiobiotin synthase [Gammaproteobacteria bacterium]